MTPPFSVEFLKSWVLWQAKIEKALCLSHGKFLKRFREMYVCPKYMYH